MIEESTMKAVEKAKRSMKSWALGASTLIVAAAASAAHAAPVLRTSADQTGNFVVIGNTVAQDCAAGVVAPLAGSTVGACGANTGDNSPDVFWRADSPAAGQAEASTNVAPADARSSAVLALPGGAQVTYARLYWAAIPTGNAADTSVVVERPGVFSQQVDVAPGETPAPTVVVAATDGTMRTYYQSGADVTELVQASGNGAYRISGIDSTDLRGSPENRAFVAWTLVVFYTRAGDPPRNLALFDGLDIVEPANPVINVALSGFLVPPSAGFDARLAVWAYEGDGDTTEDRLEFNGNVLSSTPHNPANNFFNSTRTIFGAAVNDPGDLPRLAGTPRSMSGYDLDVIDVKPYLSQGDTTATITARTGGAAAEFYILGGFVTAISTYKPDFNETTKTFVNLTRNDGTVRIGDLLEFTITTTNNGNDPGVNVALTDTLVPALVYEPGSLSIASGPNVGALSDATGDDQGEYAAGSRTITVRLGTGANATSGGTLAIGQSTSVKFRARIAQGASGTLANQAIVRASGDAGAPEEDYPSDGDPNDPGAQQTNVPIDQCGANGDCANPTPFCLMTAHPYLCVACLTDANCSGTTPICDAATHACRACAANAECTVPAQSACLATGACGECSPSRVTCVTPKPLCDVAPGVCVGCLSATDCSGTTPVCDGGTKTCRACASDGECPTALPACLATGVCGECSPTKMCTSQTRPLCDVANAVCVGCLSNADCSGNTPICDGTTRTCRACASNNDCGGTTPLCAGTGACGACVTNADCGGTSPICSPTTLTCGPCTRDADCTDPRFPACNTSGAIAGACTECSMTNATLCVGPKPQCVLSLGLCGCQDADGDSECGNMMSGIICNAPVGICVPGCSHAPMRNRCPDPQTCSDTSGAVGICQSSCTMDRDCSAPKPKCDTGVNPSVCVQCLADGDCTAPFVCDTGATKLCVECTAQKKTNCTQQGAGDECLANNTCGCVADGDCGDATSGRVCDAAVSKCSPGCRGAGGNGCPVGFVCTSADNTIGQCVRQLPGDGGAGDGGRDGEVGGDGGAGDGGAGDGAIDAEEAGGGVPGYIAGGGCNCAVAGRGDADADARGGLWLALGLGAALVWRRRRRAK